MAVRLAINPITWVNDDMPSLGAGTSLDTILSETRLAGFAGPRRLGRASIRRFSPKAFAKSAAEVPPK